jgi:hypothetical protein
LVLALSKNAAVPPSDGALSKNAAVPASDGLFVVMAKVGFKTVKKMSCEETRQFFFCMLAPMRRCELAIAPEIAIHCPNENRFAAIFLYRADTTEQVTHRGQRTCDPVLRAWADTTEQVTHRGLVTQC